MTDAKKFVKKEYRNVVESYNEQDGFNPDIVTGVEKLKKAVCSTFGPYGRPVLIQRQFAFPLATKDGVTVARQLKLRNNIQNMAIEVIKNAAERTLQQAGDGTTTSILLACALFDQIAIGFNNEKVNTVRLQNAFDYLTRVCIDKIDQWSRECNLEDIEKIATVSSNGDKGIGNLVSEAFKAGGPEAIITINRSSNFEDEIVIKDGYRFKQGMAASYFINDTNKYNCTLNNGMVLVSNDDLIDINPLIPIVTYCSNNNIPLLVIAPEFDSRIIELFSVNTLNGKLKSCLVRLPGIGDQRPEYARDIAAYTGATVIDKKIGVSFESIGQNIISTLGKFNTAIIDKDTCSLVCDINTDKVNERINLIEELLSDPEITEIEEHRLKQRLSSLKGISIEIKLSSMTDSAYKERFDRLDDAICAVRSAFKDGVLSGGTVSYITLAKFIQKTVEESTVEMGIAKNALYVALVSPFNELVQNNVDDDIFWNVDMIEKEFDIEFNTERLGFSYNAFLNNFVNELSKDHILEPAAIQKAAIMNAVSAAITLAISDVYLPFDEED
jgi:chaperonin GroEL